MAWWSQDGLYAPKGKGSYHSGWKGKGKSSKAGLAGTRDRLFVWIDKNGNYVHDHFPIRHFQK